MNVIYLYYTLISILEDLNAQQPCGQREISFQHRPSGGRLSGNWVKVDEPVSPATACVGVVRPPPSPPIRARPSRWQRIPSAPLSPPLPRENRVRPAHATTPSELRPPRGAAVPPTMSRARPVDRIGSVISGHATVHLGREMVYHDRPNASSSGN